KRGRSGRPVSLGAGKWVQLGPTVIPNGQTPSAATGGSRVNVTGRITEIVVDPISPLTMYVATAGGGIWKTMDGGVTWSPKSDNEAWLAIGALAMAPSDPNRLYAGTGGSNIFFYVHYMPLQVANEEYYVVVVLRAGDGGDRRAEVSHGVFLSAAL